MCGKSGSCKVAPGLRTAHTAAFVSNRRYVFIVECSLLKVCKNKKCVTLSKANIRTRCRSCFLKVTTVNTSDSFTSVFIFLPSQQVFLSRLHIPTVVHLLLFSHVTMYGWKDLMPHHTKLKDWRFAVLLIYHLCNLKKWHRKKLFQRALVNHCFVFVFFCRSLTSSTGKSWCRCRSWSKNSQPRTDKQQRHTYFIGLLVFCTDAHPTLAVCMQYILYFHLGKCF